jgi:serine/threonine-protein kinase HipA
VTDELLVELYGTIVAALDAHRGGIRLRFTDEARQRWGARSPILSCSMPIGDDHYDVSSFVGNLLPEGEAVRVAVGDAHGVNGLDPFALIGAIGAECAGAARVGSATFFENEPSPRVRPVEGSELAEIIRTLPRRPFGMTRDMRLSLGGNQGKILVVDRGDGQWGLPLDGAPSSHIMKPEPIDLPRGYAANEAYCMTLARHCGLTTVDAAVVNVVGWDVYIVSRYDRRVGDDGTISRIHQEDVCQAVGRNGAFKYESSGQHRLSEIAEVLRRWAPARSIETLLWHMVFHLVIGNTDAHDKNYSLVHSSDGSVDLAPMYDASSTVWRVSTNRDLASSINGVYDLDSVTFADVVAEASGWRLRRAPALALRALDRIRSELGLLRLDATIEEEMVELMTDRCDRLLDQAASHRAG